MNGNLLLKRLEIPLLLIKHPDDDAICVKLKHEMNVIFVMEKKFLHGKQDF